MKTIETTVTIGEDHLLSIQLPETVPVGEAKVIVLIEGKSQQSEQFPLVAMQRFFSNCDQIHLGLKNQITWKRDELYR